MLKRPKILPDSPGVYIFRLDRVPLYIGKAANLKRRLASYFQTPARLPVKIQKMLGEATRLETIETPSEIEAFIREADLIKHYRPKYNILMRDDKSYFYVGVTAGEFPRIFITHQPRTSSAKSGSRTNTRTVRPTRYRIRTCGKDSVSADAHYIGPFTNGTALKTVLKLLRRVFPYCTCRKLHPRPCLNSQIGRCSGYCCTAEAGAAKRVASGTARMASVPIGRPIGTDMRRRYRANIRNIIAVLTGRKTRLLRELKRQMAEAARREHFEKAGRLRDQIAGLEDVFRHRMVLHEPAASPSWAGLHAKLQSLLRTTRPIRRIEGYDISNIAGREATGSLVVFSNGVPDKSQYRKFRIKTVRDISDVAMLKEVLRRRFNHPEWPFPDLIVVDGGKPQLNAALTIVRELLTPNSQLPTPIAAALAKREEVLYAEDGREIPLKREDPAVLHLFQRIRDESHRFARVYHHKLRKRTYAEAR